MLLLKNSKRNSANISKTEIGIVYVVPVTLSAEV